MVKQSHQNYTIDLDAAIKNDQNTYEIEHYKNKIQIITLNIQCNFIYDMCAFFSEKILQEYKL